MKIFCSFCSNTISVARKYYMALSGLFLVSFLIAHLSGNLLLFKCDSGVAFNEYAHFMSSNLVIRIMEIVLAIGFLVHIILAVKLTIKNYRARPIKYNKSAGNANSTWASRNMGLTGSIILFFLIIHLKTFFVESRIYGNNDMYALVREAFSCHLYVAFYIFSLIALAIHLSHGFQSVFQSFGLYHKKYTPTIKRIGYLLAVVIPIGFATMPIYFYFYQ